MAEPTDQQANAPEAMSFAEFLETIPPSQPKRIKDLCAFQFQQGTGMVLGMSLSTPEVQLHCPTCSGTRFFRSSARSPCSFTLQNFGSELFLQYACSNCRVSAKVYALSVTADGWGVPSGKGYKFGEAPVFGPPTPGRLLKLLGDDREAFLKGSLLSARRRESKKPHYRRDHQGRRKNWGEHRDDLGVGNGQG